jgi:hypothetical protein
MNAGKDNRTRLFEILVPTVRNDGRPIRTRFHKVWDEKVKAITRGLTVMPVARGQWVSPEDEEFTERMIPVRIMATDDEMDKIVNMSAKYYEQLAIMFYVISEEVQIRAFDN